MFSAPSRVALDSGNTKKTHLKPNSLLLAELLVDDATDKVEVRIGR